MPPDTTTAAGGRGDLRERAQTIRRQLAGMRAKAVRLASAIRERETNLARLEASAEGALPPARRHDDCSS
jgi:hypothetical protein